MSGILWELQFDTKIETNGWETSERNGEGGLVLSKGRERKSENFHFSRHKLTIYIVFKVQHTCQ